MVGIGPGSRADMTAAAVEALGQADVVVGYKGYIKQVATLVRPGCQLVDTGMKRERERAEEAFTHARQGRRVAVVSSGDAGIYGMAPLIYEMQQQTGSHDIVVNVVPGISAFQKAAALLGAPIGHDLCLLSLSDLLTPWSLIERRIRAAAMGDFVTAVYNPRSHDRYWQLHRLRELFLEEGRSPDTPVGIVRQAGREDEAVGMATLGTLDADSVDMFTILIIGNSQTRMAGGVMLTPRGYYNTAAQDADTNTGAAIMTESFRTIYGLMSRHDYPLDHLWALLHAIHTTADFDMEKLLRSDPDAVTRIYNKVKDGTCTTIVTDVTMVVSGVRKGALSRLGVVAKCYLGDERAVALAAQEGITRSAAGIRIAVTEHPDALFAFGNAPTALMELCALMRRGVARPAGIVAAPVGFVHVCESKHMVKPFAAVPKLIVEGRKGGSNLAATLCNAILTLDDARGMRPGRDV